MKTRQEMIDIAVAHLATMEERCTDGDGECMYRGPDGQRCLIGAMIPDDGYTPNIEGCNAAEPFVYGPAGIAAKDANFARLLQRCHDNTEGTGATFRREVADKIRELCNEYGLTFP